MNLKKLYEIMIFIILIHRLNFRKILVPYEGSYLADKALEYALELANMNNHKRPSEYDNGQKTEIILLHVVPEIPITNVLFERPIRTSRIKGSVVLSEYVRELYQQVEEGMREILERKKMESKINSAFTEIKVLTLVGSPANKIVDFASDETVDLIIIGSNGLKGMSKFFKGLGIVARTVSERASCTVIITR
jgi:nucleotide-binding universal stress UspA family protein